MEPTPDYSGNVHRWDLRLAEPEMEPTPDGGGGVVRSGVEVS